MTLQRTLACLCVVGCTGGGAETGTDTDGADTDVVASAQVTWELQLSELVSDEPLAGASLTVPSGTYTADASGATALLVDAEAYVTVEMSHEGFLDATFQRFIGDSDWFAARALPSKTAIEELAGFLELVPDTAKGQVLAVNLLDCSPYDNYLDCSFLTGATIDLDLDYDLAVVDDANSLTGLSVGNTSIDAAVSFLNVTTGTAGLTIDPPDGYTCEYVPPTIEVKASHFQEVSIYCTSE